MVGTAGKGVPDGVLVGVETIGADLRRSNHALAQILDKQVRILAVALTGAVGDDGLSRRPPTFR